MKISDCHATDNQHPRCHLSQSIKTILTLKYGINEDLIINSLVNRFLQILNKHLMERVHAHTLYD